ncbi:MAG TPA: hypothetical protein VMY77_18600 [Chitinophagaceae bacterium]|nr:hypothetical protein [Chitinophagaceae bacterium]
MDGHEWFVSLVRHIKSSEYFYRLFATTSLDRLVVSNSKPLQWKKDMLLISFDTTLNKWHFSYHAFPNYEAEISKTYPAKDGQKKFDEFIENIQW